MNIKKEISVSILFNILTIAISLGFISYLSKELSLDDFGYYQLLITFIGFIGVFSMSGLNMILNKNILKGQDSIFNATFYKNYKIVLMFFLFFLFVSCIGKIFFSSIKIDLFCIALLFLPLLGLERYESILYAKQKFIDIRVLNLSNTFLYVLFSIILLEYTKNYLYVFLAMFIVKSLMIFLGLKYALSLLSKEKTNNTYVDELKESYKLSFLSFYNVGIGLVDKLILGFLDIRLLAIYAIGVLIPLKVKDQVKLVLSIVVQRWAKNGERNYIDNINKYIYIIVGFNIFLSFSLAFFSQLYIPIIFSEEYLKSIYVIWIISFSIPFIMSEYIYQTYIVVFHNTEVYRKIIYTKHILYLTSLVILLPLYSIEGVAFASFLRNFYSFMLNYIYYNKYKKRVM